ncbi:MAG: histidine kinase, partial [Halieaceae bacterium]|nr:histidine kinase [Halieaceae bacterium]
MTAFATIILHAAVCYLHVIFAWRFYPRRHEDYSVFAFWMMMSLWALMHGLYAIELFLEMTGTITAFYYALTVTSYFILPFVTALMIPIFIGELTVSPPTPHALARLLLAISRNSHALFYLALALCGVNIGWSLLHLFPLEDWYGQRADIKALYGVYALFSLWFVMLISGIRPDERWREMGKPLRILLVALVGMWLIRGSSDSNRFWSIEPVLSTVSFSFIFSWYRFRLQFIDMILNQCVNILLLVLAVTGLGQLLAHQAFIEMEDSSQYLLLFAYCLAAVAAYRLVNHWFSRIWTPSSTVLAEVHGALPAILADCESEQTAIRETEDYIASVFRCKVGINRSLGTSTANSIRLTDAPAIEVNLGYIRDWMPWLSRANEWAQTAALYLQNHLHMQASHASLIKTEELSTLAARAELDAMRAQIRPHFMFNTLNSIHSFVREEPELAEKTIERLSELMRAVLSAPDEDTVPLHQELNVVRNYLAIEKARFGDRLHYEISIDPGDEQQSIPPFSLQPLVENTIKHGLEGQFSPLSVTVEAETKDSSFTVRVIDNGPGLSGSNHGMGMAVTNIRERLDRLYADSAQLKLT